MKPVSDDLFTSRASGPQDDPPEDYEYRAWAERVIHEVGEHVAKEDRALRDFVEVWIRWKDLAALVHWIELNMYRRSNPQTAELRWHETLVTMLLAQGNLIDIWAQSVDSDFKKDVGFDAKVLETTLQSLRNSWQEWHGEKNRKRLELIRGLIPAQHDPK